MAETDQARDPFEGGRTGETLEQIQQQLETGREIIAQQRAHYQAVLRELRQARATANDRSWELADLEQRLGELNEQREGPVDPLLEREIAQLAGQRAQIEERVLAQLLLVDDLAARARAEEQELAAAQQDWAARETALRADRERLDE